MNVIEHLMEGGDKLLDKTFLLNASKIGYLLREPTWAPSETWVSMHDKVCVVTGGNSGLGRVVSTRLAGLGARVYLLCRDEARGKRAQFEIVNSTQNLDVFLEIVDVSDAESVRGFVDRFTAKESRVDVLINNAGVFKTGREETDSGLEVTFATNTLGPFLLTNLLMPALRRSEAARVITVSSAAMYFAKLNLDDPQFQRRPYVGPLAYAESKRAEVELTHCWSERLQASTVGVHAMHPGWADTPSAWGAVPSLAAPVRPLLRTPEQGADTLLWLAVNPRVAEHERGRFWFDRRPRDTHRLGFGKSSEAERESFWELCCDLSGYTPDTASFH
jgi:NAD(P)-dependent dehydrogenase (short-subunit alcohol dehydrogenase family)